MNKLISKIKRLRAKSGWTQKELAKRSGLAHITIRVIETGVKRPSLETRKKLARALGVSVVELLD